MKNLLLLGGGGFIGSNLIKCLTQYNGSLTLFAVEPKDADIHRLYGLQIQIYRISLEDTDNLETIIVEHSIDTVVHLVSTLVPGSSYDEYIKEIRSIIIPSIDLLKVCTEKNVMFVFFSSGGTIYGNRKTNMPFSETDETAPISYYGQAKQMMEQAILFMHRTHNLKYLIVRPSNAYGKGQNLKGNQGLIAVSLGNILANKPIHVWGDGSAVRDYIYIEDLCKAFCSLLINDITDTTVNIGSGVGYSVNEVLQYIRDVTSIDFDVIYEKARSADISTMILDTSRLNSFINMQYTSLAKGIESFYKFLKREYE